jgi:hypothetical protein
MHTGEIFMKKAFLIAVLLLLLSATTQAQSAPNHAIALSLVNDTLTLSQVTLPNDTNYISFAPTDPNRYARIDAIGLIRFIPPGGPEGVYTFSPYTDGFTAGSAIENRLRAREAILSPNGTMLAFRVQNDVEMLVSDGVWFWQPARDLPTDPSYQLLRQCPPCELSGGSAGAGWRTTSLEWASDNQAILIGLMLTNEGRRALHVAYAVRDNAQSIRPANPLRYDYGHWTVDGQRIIVSGTGTDGAVIFGSVGRDGNNAVLRSASEIGLVWTQDAVDVPSLGKIVMLGSAIDATSPLQLFDDTGSALTPSIGSGVPSTVIWSPDRRAVFVRIGSTAYVAQVNGIVTDITSVVQNVPAVNWINGAVTTNATPLPVPQPLSTSATEIPKAGVMIPATGYSVGQLLRVEVTGLALYAEPVTDSRVVTTLSPGTELILTAGPLTDGVTVWWRVQTLNFSGWLTERRDGVATMLPTS